MKVAVVIAVAALAVVAVGCRGEFECADACARMYDECGAAVEVEGVALSRAQCELVCEEGRGEPGGGVTLWLDCVADSVCPGEQPDDEDRELRRYDVTWCNPIFEQFTQAL